MIINFFFNLYRTRKRKEQEKLFSFIAGHLHHSSSSYAVFPAGCFLLDARGRNLLLLVYCENLQHQEYVDSVSRHGMGYSPLIYNEFYYC